MRYWVFKSEPETWSWTQQVAKGKSGEAWNGVRNHQANNFMKEMKAGDQGYFYHSGEEREIVGIVEVIGEHEPDPTDEKGKFGLVTVRALRPLKTPVPLAALKADPRFKDLLLVRHSRISVSPVGEAEWRAILALGGLNS